MAIPYEIAVKLTAGGNLANALTLISNKLLGLNTHVKDLEKNFGRVGTAIAGVGAVIGGAAVLGVFVKLVDNAKELSHQLATLRTFNLSDTDIKIADKEARRVTAAVPGTTESGNVKLIGEAYSLFGKEGAKKILEPLARFGQVIGGITGDYEGASEQLYAMLRSGDLMGKLVDEKTHKVSADKLLNFLDVASKLMAATHMKVNPATFFQMAQQGGPALANMDEEGLLTMGMVAQGMGGFRAGTAMTSLQQQFLGGKMTAKVADELHDLGLVGGFEKKFGSVAHWDTGALDTPFAKAIMKDPAAAADILQKNLVEHGFTDLESQTKELYKILGRQTTQRIISDLIRNLPQMLSERGRIEGAMGIDDQAKIRNADDLITVEHNLAAAWQNLNEAIAGPQSKMMIGMINELSGAINSITGTFRGMSAETLGNIGKGILAIGVGLTAFGAVATIAALAAFVPGGIAAAAVSGIATAIGTLSLLNWKPAADAISGVGNAIKWFVESIDALPKHLFDSLTPKDSNHNKSLGGPGDMLPGIQNQSYRPGSGGDAANIHVHLHLDNTEVASAVTTAMLRSAQFPSRAPYQDTRAAYAPPDVNLAWG